LGFEKAENLRINIVDYQNLRTAIVQERIEPRRGQYSFFVETLDSVLLLLPVPQIGVYIHSIL
jgi:hypothetical protein